MHTTTARRSSLPFLDEQKKLTRSSTLSKIKRVGSLLIKSKTTEQESISPSPYIRTNSHVRPRIQTVESSSNTSLTSNLSLTSSISIAEESEEECLVTPTSSNITNTLLNHSSVVTLTDSLTEQPVTELQEFESNVKPPKINTEKPKSETFYAVPVPISSSTYPTVSLVRSHLQSIFDTVDEEIEEGFERSREIMIQSLYKAPLYNF